MLNPDIKLSVYLNGRLIKAPILLTVIGLRETLLVASDYDEAKVNQICSRLHDTGTCSLSSGDNCTVYKIEKVLAS